MLAILYLLIFAMKPAAPQYFTVTREGSTATYASCSLSISHDTVLTDFDTDNGGANIYMALQTYNDEWTGSNTCFTHYNAVIKRMNMVTGNLDISMRIGNGIYDKVVALSFSRVYH